jgi:hypothetical protein
MYSSANDGTDGYYSYLNQAVRTFENNSIPILQRGYCLPAPAANLTGQALLVSSHLCDSELE